MPRIIIFGAAVRADGTPSGAMRQRVAAALACAGPGRDATFMPTGGQGRFGPPEAEVMASLLEAAGVPRDRIVIERTGTNTLRSVLACAALVRGGDGPVWVATSAYHVPRCLTLLRLAGVRARACRPGRRSASARRLKRWWWRLRELPAVPVDSLVVSWLRLRGKL